MKPVALQIPGHERDEIVIGKDQPEYVPLPALRLITEEGIATVTRWRPSDEERAQLLAGADIWLQQLTGRGPLQPVKVGVECPVLLNQVPS